MKIRVIFCDLGGVLVVNKAKEIGEKYEKSDGLTPEMTRKVFRFIQTAKRTNEDIYEYLRSENISQEVWERFVKEFYASEIRNDSLIEILYKAKGNGILIIFTTNNSDAVIIGVKKYNIEGLADRIVKSSELGVAKPDKEYWEEAFKEARKFIPDLKPEEILVIDDSKTNYQSAIDYGYKAYKYVNDQKSIEEISNLIY